MNRIFAKIKDLAMFLMFITLTSPTYSFASMMCLEMSAETDDYSPHEAKYDTSNGPAYIYLNNKKYNLELVQSHSSFVTGKVLSQLWRSCLGDSSNFLRKGDNEFSSRLYWPADGSTVTSGWGRAKFTATFGSRKVTLCDLRFDSNNTEQKCNFSNSFDVSGLDPEVAARLARLNSDIKNALKELDDAYLLNQDEFKRIDDIFIEMDKTALNDINCTKIKNDFPEACKLIEDAKLNLAQLKASALAKTDEVKKKQVELNARLAKVVDEAGLADAALPELPPLEIPPLSPSDDGDTFTEDIYGAQANAIIDEMKSKYPDDPSGLILLAMAWQKQVADMMPVIEPRKAISPREVTAFYASVSKVQGFLFQTGCDGKGCLTTDLWPKNTPVPPTLREMLNNELKDLNVQKSQALQAEMRRWKTLDENQKKIIAAIDALGRATRALGRLAADESTYLRGRLDAILTSAVTAAKNGACLAGRIAPGVNDLADWYEVLNRKDLCSGEELSRWEQVLSGVGIIIGSGKLWRTLGNEISGVEEVAKRAGDFVDGAAYLKRYGPLEKGPLHLIQQGSETVADTFRSSSYFEILTKEDTILYRVYDTSRSKDGLGAYWSRTKPLGPLQAQLDSAINPNWNTTPKAWVGIKVPKGTKIFEGAVSPQIIRSSPSKFPVGSLYGGGSQVYLDLKVPSSWIQDDLRGVF